MYHGDAAPGGVFDGGVDFAGQAHRGAGVGPDLAVFEEDVFDGFPGFDAEAVVGVVDEAVAHYHVLAAGDDDAVGVLEEAEDAEGVDADFVALREVNGPTAGVGNDDVADGDVLDFGAAEHGEAFHLREGADAGDDAASADGDVGAVDFDGGGGAFIHFALGHGFFAGALRGGAHDGAAGEVEGLAFLEDDGLDVVDAGGEIEDVGVLGRGDVGFGEVGEEVEGVLAVACGVNGDVAGGFERELDDVAGDDGGDVEGGGEDADFFRGAEDAFAEFEADFYGGGEVEDGVVDGGDFAAADFGCGVDVVEAPGGVAEDGAVVDGDFVVF